jgi:hypothetical protein
MHDPRILVNQSKRKCSHPYPYSRGTVCDSKRRRNCHDVTIFHGICSQHLLDRLYGRYYCCCCSRDMISFIDGVATRVHAPPFFTWYLTRAYKTGAVPPPNRSACHVPLDFPPVNFLLVEHGRKMSPIWIPFTDVGDHYVRVSSRHDICKVLLINYGTSMCSYVLFIRRAPLASTNDHFLFLCQNCFLPSFLIRRHAVRWRVSVLG